MSTFTAKSIEIRKESKAATPALCALCNRPRMVSGQAVCRDADCQKFDYKNSVNVLCAECSKECKQYAHVKVLMCPKYERK